MDRRTDGWTYILSHRYACRLTDRWTAEHADIRAADSNIQTYTCMFIYMRRDSRLRDEYRDRRIPSLLHPHRHLRTHTHASTYMHASDVLARMHSFTSKFKHRSYKLKARNKKLEIRNVKDMCIHTTDLLACIQTDGNRQDGRTIGRTNERKENIQTDRVTYNLTKICIQPGGRRTNGHIVRQYSNW